jgi:hypothetical protein
MSEIQNCADVDCEPRLSVVLCNFVMMLQYVTSLIDCMV